MSARQPLPMLKEGVSINTSYTFTGGNNNNQEHHDEDGIMLERTKSFN
jgi:hypothetical protein